MNTGPDLTREVQYSAGQLIPGAAASAFTLNHLVIAGTLALLAIQIGYHVWKWRREWRKAQADDHLQGRAA